MRAMQQSASGWIRTLSRVLAALLICAAGALPWAGRPEASAPSEVNQTMPGLADTPGTKPSLPAADRSLGGNTLKTEQGLAVLDSDLLLKVYFFAYSGQTVDYGAILSENTEHIGSPASVTASAAQKLQIDRLIDAAKAHPDLLIKVDDIALDRYDKAGKAYPIQNRLFIKGVGYYFDNSPFHYVYSDAAAFHLLHCTDGKAIATVDAAIANYQHFSMDIVGHVSGAIAKDKALSITPSRVTLKDASGGVLITQAGGS